MNRTKNIPNHLQYTPPNPPSPRRAPNRPPRPPPHDPHRALFGGVDGLDVIRGLVPTIARLLRPGGGTAIEHDDSNGSALAALLAETGAFTEIAEHPDLAGKPRFVAAVRS
ncbi:hypothetical protein [Nocardia cyriacigeorgica]|uniref:hypothetical protein n=1 Tax=Nocardia cyriacigeorgica TaxID=135487 RepID=UPI003CC7EF73